jgi:amino acid adenylation domain-containing protein
LVEEPVLKQWVALLAGTGGDSGERDARDAAPAAPTSAAFAYGASGDESFPLATMQHAYWVGRQDGQPLGGVAAHFYTELDGERVEPDRLRHALRALTARHSMLRARFDDEGRQRFRARDGERDTEPRGSELIVHDLREAADPEVSATLDSLRERYTHARMDVAAGYVLLVALSLLPGGRTRLHVDLDMMVGDALSLRVLLRDLRDLYEGAAEPLPELSLDYPSYLAAHTASQAAERERAARWWRERLPELPSPPRLPFTVDPLHSVSAADTALTRAHRLHHRLDPQAKAVLIARARDHGITPAAVLATAFAESIAAWSDSRRFLLNLPVFDRELITPDVAGMIGDFSSSLLLDADLREDLPFTEQARRIQDGIRLGIAHSAYSGVDVLRDLARHQGAPVLAPVVYTSAIGLGEIFEHEVQCSLGRPVWIISQGPQVVLDAQVTELDGGLLLNWDVREGLFAPGVPDAAFTAYRSIVDRLVSSEDAWLSPVGPLLPAGSLEAHARAASPATPLPQHALHTRFFTLADKHPDNTAVVSEGGSPLSYGQLALAARKLAACLRTRGVSPDDTVAVTLPKGADQVVAVLGVLAAGAAYVPVGLDQPPVRRAHILRIAGATVVVTDDVHAGLVEQIPGVTALRLRETEDAQPGPITDPDPEATAYLIFTSGSTGLPKGVEVPHRAAVNTVDALADLFAVGPDDATLALSALDFDLSVYDVFAPLSVGGRVVTVAEEHRRDAVRWGELIRAHRVTVVNCVPALLDLLLAATQDGSGLDPLRLVLLGGDWVGLDQPARLHAQAPGCRFVVLGGMTEAAIHSTVLEVTEAGVDPQWKSIPYGLPLRNTRARVVDERGYDRPDLVPGELWVGGRGLATGYRGDPERTAARFVEYDGQRWYRSGDLARWLPDGTLEFLGRADHQVKIRGHRIELGEIEAALQSHPRVLHAVAAVIGDSGGRLAALVSPAGRDPAGPSADDLREWMAPRLPSYMRPDHLLVRPALPLTANGKLDRAAVGKLLDAAVRDADGRGGRDGLDGGHAPVGTVEKTVAALWAELLGQPEVGRNDSFFSLGGDSLLATRMVSRLRALGMSGPGVAVLFAAPVLRDFAARLRPDARTTAPVPAVEPDAEHAHEPFALTEVQSAYVTGRGSGFTLGGVGTWHYSEFDGSAVDLQRLERAWHVLVRRHSMLRAVIEDGEQRVLADVPDFRIPVNEVTGEQADGALEELRAAMSHEIRDPARWPLFDIQAVRYPAPDATRNPDGAVRTRIGVGLDYVVLDALSIVTLYTEWSALYADPSAADRLPPVDLTFRDYQMALTARAAADPQAAQANRDHWRARLDELPPAPRLPYRTDPASVDVPRFTRRRTVLDAASWGAVKAQAIRQGLTPSTVLLAAYGETLAAWSGTDAVSVTLTLFNRHEIHPHVHRIVGDFTSLSLAGYHRAAGPWLPALRELQQRQAEDLDHQDVPATWLLRELTRRTGTLDAAAPVVFTSALGVGDASLADRATGFPRKTWGVTQSPQVCLDHQVTEENGELVVTWDAVEELFHPGVLDDMAAAHARILDHLAVRDWSESVPDLLPPGQRSQRAALNASAPAEPRLLHAAFFFRAAEEPGRAALIAADGRVLTYGETAEAALRTANALRQRGVVDGDLVAVTLPKGPEQIVAVLGVLAAGAAYVPIGVEQPAARRARIIRAAGVRVTIAREATEMSGHEREEGPERKTGESTRLRTGDQAGDEPADGTGESTGVLLTPADARTCPPADAPRPLPADALAYTIFTSGSTGEPKGVRIGHAAAWNTVADINDRHGIGPEDRVLALSALDFDLSVYDVFGLLSAGGALVLPAEEQRREPDRWRALVREHGVTVWNTVPALLDLLLDLPADDGSPAAARGPARSVRNNPRTAQRPSPGAPNTQPTNPLGTLRTALVSGDWIGLDLPDRLRTATGGRCRFTAMGGATEASIWSNAHEVTAAGPEPAWTSIPYGFPLTGQRYRVAASGGHDCPDWVAGELWIGGAGLADGYLGDPVRTAEKFVKQDGERWYRTGDVGRYRPGGVLEFLGRTDAQLKIAGHRIEAGEVEAAIEAHPRVSRAAVVATGTRTARRLAAFVVLAEQRRDLRLPDKQRPGERPFGEQARGGRPVSEQTLGDRHVGKQGEEHEVPPSTPPCDAWLRPWLTERLAPYALPATTEALAALPLTANGKVDRPALAALASAAGTAAPGAAAATPPEGRVETEIAGLWNTVLPSPVHDRHTNFFAAGGDSLSAIRLVAAIERALGARIPVRTLLAAPTLAALGAEVTAAVTAVDHDTETGEL